MCVGSGCERGGGGGGVKSRVLQLAKLFQIMQFVS